METIKKIRKIGTGLYPHKREKLGVYKIYGLIDPDTKDIFYVGVTKNYLCKRLEIHLNGIRRLNTKSEKDLYIKSILDRGQKPQIKELDLLPEEKETLKRGNIIEVKTIENKYIKLYGITNKKLNTFKGKPVKIDRSEMIDTIIKLKNENLSTDQIVKKSGYKKSTVYYYLKKIGGGKKSEIREQNRWIVQMLRNNFTIKQMSYLLQLKEDCLYKRIKNYELAQESKNNNEEL